MADFTAIVKAILDTSGLKAQLQNLRGTVKVDVDTSNIDKSFNSAQKKANSLGDTLKRSFNIGAAATITAKGVQLIHKAFREATTAVKDFDAAITDVRTVTGASYPEAAKMVRAYNKMGKEFGATTKEVTDSAVTWLRQGKSAQETSKLIYETTKLAKVGFINEADAANYLTSSLNGFKLTANDAASVIDKLAKLDSAAAVTAGGLAEGMSRTAVTANNAGISMDKLLGILTAIGNVNPNLDMATIGNSVKTILTRMSNIKAGKLELIDEDGTVETLSDVETVLNNAGIKLRDSENEFRNFGDVLDEVGAAWDTYSNVQQAAIAKAFAGTRQQENFRVLMNNYKSAIDFANLAADSAGTADQKFAAYLDSVEAKTKQLQASIESLAFNAISTELVGGLVDGATAIVDFLDKTNLLKSSIAGLGVAGAVKGFTLFATGIANAAIRMNQFNAALKILKTGNIANDQIQQLAYLTQNLSQSQLKAVLSSKVLTAQQRVAILTSQGMTTAQAEAAAGAMGLAAANGTAAASTFSLSAAFKGLLSTLAANPFVLIAAGVTAAVTAFSAYKQHVEDLRTKAQESAQTFDEARTSIEDYTKKVKDLREKLDSGNLSEAEAYETKKQLLDIQNQLNETYGKSAAGLDLVNGQLDEQIDKLNELTALEASRYLNENAEAIAIAEREMTKTLGGEGGWATEAGSYIGQFYDNAMDDTVKLKEILGKYSDFIKLDDMQDGNGTIRIRFVGDAKDAKSVLNDLMTDLRYASNEFKDSFLFNDIFTGVSKVYAEADEIIQNYETYFEKAKEARLIEESYSNAKKVYETEKGNGKTAIDWLEDYTDAIKSYNEALSSGDTDKIAQAKAQFDSIDASVKSLIANNTDFAYFASLFENVRNSLNESAISADKFGRTLKHNWQATDFMQKTSMTDVQFADAFISGLGSDQTSRAVKMILKEYAEAFGIDFGELTAEQVEWVADYLVDAGILVRDAASELESSVAGSVDETKSAANTALSVISKARELIANQKAGQSISLADYNSEEMKPFLDAVEYRGGVFQLDAERVNELASAQAELAVQTNNHNKALAQAKYLDNAKQIDILSDSLKNLGENETDARAAIEAEINSLRNQNVAIRETCNEYRILNAELQAAYGEYQHWINSQSASDYGDLFSSTVTAIDQIQDTIQNTGNFGSLKYKAALDLIIPNTVNREDAAAVQNYVESIGKYLTTEDGRVTGMNLSAFLEDSQKAGLMNYDADSDRWDINPGVKLEDFARELNLAEGMANAFFDEIQLKGGDISFEDEIVQSFGDIAMAAYDAKDSIAEAFGEEYAVNIDVSNIETTQGKLDSLDATISEMNRLKATPGIDTSQIQNANDVIQYCVAQKQLLTEPAIMKVDTSQVQGGLGDAIGLLQQFQSLANQREIMIALGLDTSSVDAQISDVTKQIQTNETIKANLQIDTTSAESIASSIQGIDVPALVEYGVDASAVEGYNPDTKQIDVIYNPNDSALPTSFDSIDRTVNYVANTSGLPSSFSTITRYVNYVSTGNNKVNGTANVSGTAMAGGNWGTAEGGQTLVGELGKEIVVDPHSGRWYTVGDRGAEFRNIPAGSIVFNHKQTESLLENGYVLGRARALANGTAMVTGGISGNYVRPSKKDDDEDSGKPSGSYGGSGSDQSSKDDEDAEKIDWIERLFKKIEREIEKFRKVAESAFKSLSSRLSASKTDIEKMTDEIDAQTLAYKRYMQEAESVGGGSSTGAIGQSVSIGNGRFAKYILNGAIPSKYKDAVMNQLGVSGATGNSSGLSESIKALIRDGTIDISKYDKDTRELISEYQEYFDKAQECLVAIDDLREQIAQFYRDSFDNIQSNAENQVKLIDHTTSMYSGQLSILKEQGYMDSTKLYESMMDVEIQRMKSLQQEKKDLQGMFNAAMASGEIEEDSEAWYDMLIAIDEVDEAIQESTLNLVKYGNSIQKLHWEYFDYLQDKISGVADETEYLIDLLSYSKLFDDNGAFNDKGTAVAGLHAQNYGIYMAQADQYAKEIKSLDAELANDPNNQTLIERRQKLLELQQKSIKSAEDEKKSLVDLVEDGISAQVKAMQDLIDTYKDSLDSAKDLYDYQKKVSKQTKNIAEIEKQLSAYQNNTSEETRATVQKLKEDLESAREDLQDTEYNQYINDQKKMLDDLYSEYEETLNSRLDDIDGLIQNMIDYANANSSSISDTILAATGNVGYTLSDTVRKIWSREDMSLDGVVTHYGDDFGNKLTSTNAVLGGIYAAVSAMISASDQIAVKKYAKGGLVNYTGIAQVDGTPGKPESFLDAVDSQNIGELKDSLRKLSSEELRMLGNTTNFYYPQLAQVPVPQITYLPKIPDVIREQSEPEINNSTNITFGDILIDHVDNYNDFVKQLLYDRNFEKAIQAMTINLLRGGDRLDKYHHIDRICKK